MPHPISGAPRGYAAFTAALHAADKPQDDSQPVVRGGLSESVRAVLRALPHAWLLFARVAHAESSGTGSVVFDGPSALIASNGLVEKAVATACGVADGRIAFFTQDDHYNWPTLVALKTALTQGALDGCHAEVHFHHPTNHGYAVATPFDGMRAMYPLKEDAAGQQLMDEALDGLASTLREGLVQIEPVPGVRPSFYNLNAAVGPNEHVDIVGLPLNNIATAICPVGPEPGRWHYIKPWFNDTRSTFAVSGAPTYAILNGYDAFNVALKHRDAGFAFMDGLFERMGISPEQKRGYWTQNGHLVVELAHAVGPDNITMVLPATMTRAFRTLARTSSGVQLFEPAARRTTPHDICADAAGKALAPAEASDPLIERLVHALHIREKPKGIESKGIKFVEAQAHGLLANVRLINAILAGLKKAGKPVHYFIETGCEPSWTSKSLALKEKVVDLYRRNTVDLLKALPDTVQEAKLMKHIERDVSIHPKTLCYEHANGTLADFAHFNESAFLSVGASHAFGRSTGVNRLDEQWEGKPDEPVHHVHRVPDHLEGAQKQAAYENQQLNHRVVEQALEQGPAVVFVNNEMFASGMGRDYKTFIDWCSAPPRNWMTMTLPLGANGTATVIGRPEDLLGSFTSTQA